MCRIARLLLAVILLSVAAPPSSRAAADTITGSATVQDDGSLSVDGRIVRLHGIWIPLAGRSCSTIVRPTRCLSKAALALSYKVTSFVHCRPVRALADGSIEAYCSLRGDRLFDPREDLGAWMVENGLALARPDAPFEYAAMERLARSQELGFWGDRIFNVR
jgi:endonuclease YncB( thermonuclease family)